MHENTASAKLIVVALQGIACIIAQIMFPIFILIYFRYIKRLPLFMIKVITIHPLLNKEGKADIGCCFNDQGTCKIYFFGPSEMVLRSYLEM